MQKMKNNSLCAVFFETTNSYDQIVHPVLYETES